MEQAIAGFKNTDRSPHDEETLNFSVEVVQRSFDPTLIADRHIGPDLEAWTLASDLAARTATIELIVAVHPDVLAPQLAATMGASLNRISNGRFAMSVVNGWWEGELHNFSNKLDTSDARYRRMGEFLEIAHRLWAGGLWAGETFSYHGEFFVPEGGCVPTRPIDGIPPIYAASRSDSGLEMVVRRAVVCHI